MRSSLSECPLKIGKTLCNLSQFALKKRCLALRNGTKCFIFDAQFPDWFLIIHIFQQISTGKFSGSNWETLLSAKFPTRATPHIMKNDENYESCLLRYELNLAKNVIATDFNPELGQLNSVSVSRINVGCNGMILMEEVGWTHSL